MKYFLPSIASFFCGSLLLLSCAQPEPKTETATRKPNILVIVADDLGFNDIEPFGTGIHTPALNQLSKESLLFSNFHVQPTCSPTRSSLLTGNDNHVAGIGVMSETIYPAIQHLPGYAGHLSDQVVTIPEILSGTGYHSYMVGKWHLGEKAGENPHDRGFEETFILGAGGGSHWDDKKSLAPPQIMEYTRNGVKVDLPKDFYSTRNYTDSLIGFIDKNKADKKPFFAYLAYTAPHDPLQAPKDYIDKYKGKFDMGWDSLRTLNLNNLKAMGLIPKNIDRLSPNPAIPKWSTLSKHQKEEFARDMEIYAAMIDYMDMSIGRLLEKLKQDSMYDNTMIIFMSDNGANGAVATTYPGNADGKYLKNFNNELENRGLPNSFAETGPGWAQASSSPFRFFKGFTTEGGIHTPLFIKMPGGTKNAGQWNPGFVHVTDLMPTILAVTKDSYPSEFKGKKIHPMIGKSLVPVINGDSVTVHTNDGMGWELFEMKAYIKGKWKILRLPKPFGTGGWQLYDLEIDPTEITDLSDKYPEVKEGLIKAWNQYAVENEVFDHHGHFDSLYQVSYIPKNEDD